MFLHKKAASGAVKRLRAALSLDFGTSCDNLIGSCNVEREGKRLVSRFKRRELFLFTDSLQALATNGDVFFVLCEDGMYSVVGSSLEWLTEDVARQAAAVVYRGDLIVSAKELGTCFVTTTQSKQVLDKSFSSMTVCADRLFGLQQKEVYYTAAGERDGWANGEMITLPSVCDALVTVDGKVYALGNTCYKISPNGDDIEFHFKVFANNIGAVEERSPVTYNGKAVFATVNGLYQISSDKIAPIFDQLNELVDFGGCAGVMFDGRYYLTCRTKNATEKGNNVTLVLDLDREEIVGVLDSGFDSICAAHDMLYATWQGHCYWIETGVEKGKYTKSNINFASSEKKFLDKLTVTTLNNLAVTIRSEREVRLYKIKGRKTPQKINLRDMGCEFSIELSSSDGLCVENVELFAHTCGEV